MARPVKDAKNKHIASGFTEIVNRGRGSLTSRKPGTDQHAFTTQVGGRGWHFGQEPFTEVNEVDTAWVVSSGLWDYEVTKNDFHSFVRDSVPVSYRYVDAATQHYVELTVNAVEWVNDEGQSETAASFSQVTPTINDDEIKWSDIATGWDIRVQAQTGRLVKWLDIDSLANLGSPTIGGTNIRLQMRFTFQKSSGLEVWVNGVQWEEKNNTWAETSGDIEFRDSITQQPVFYFQRPSGFDNIGDVAPMSQRVRRLGVNFYAEVDTPWNWLQSATYPISLDETVDEQVGASADDVTWKSWGNFQASGAIANMGGEGSGDNNAYRIGLRFTGVTIEGTIDTSYLTVRAWASITSGGSENIWAEDADNPGQITSYTDGEGRSKTTETIAWSYPSISEGNWENTDSINDIVQELVDSYTISNDAVQFILTWDGSAEKYSYLSTYDDSSSNAAQLHVEYTAGGEDEKLISPMLIRSNQIPIHQLQL